MSKRTDRRMGAAPWVPGKDEGDGLWRGLDGKLYVRPSFPSSPNRLAIDPPTDLANYRRLHQRPYSGWWRLKQALRFVLVYGGLAFIGLTLAAYVIAKHKGYL